MNRVVRDIFKEDQNSNKFSSKKFMGIISGFICFLSYLLDMFTVYKVNETLFDSMLFFSAGMLGVSIIKNFSRNGGGSISVGSNQGGYGYNGGTRNQGGYSGDSGYGNGYGNGYGDGYNGGYNKEAPKEGAYSDPQTSNEDFHNPNYDDSEYNPK